MRRRAVVVVAAGFIAVASCSDGPGLPFEAPQDGEDASTAVEAGADARSAADAATDAKDADAGPDAGCRDPDSGAPLVDFEPIATTPLYTVETIEHAGRLYVLGVRGQVYAVDEDGGLRDVLDVTDRFVWSGEGGLLGMAFHPRFATNGFVYLYYTIPHPTQPPPAGVLFQSQLVRYHSNDGGRTLDPASAHPILTVDQPFGNHKGGTIGFGKDGYLYWGLGDGGSQGDPQGNAQNKRSLLGKMLRLDVDGADPYAIPPTNPFADEDAGAKELFAYGFRNPFRWRFDDVTGDLWAGDVGGAQREEINRVVLGGNYGWNIREGTLCSAGPCDDAGGLTPPVVEHPRGEAASIIGGVVYRGTKIPALTGMYVYGDFGTKRWFMFSPSAAAPRPQEIVPRVADIAPTAINLDGSGEIIVTSYSGGLFRMVAVTTCP